MCSEYTWSACFFFPSVLHVSKQAFLPDTLTSPSQGVRSEVPSCPERLLCGWTLNWHKCDVVTIIKPFQLVKWIHQEMKCKRGRAGWRFSKISLRKWFLRMFSSSSLVSTSCNVRYLILSDLILFWLWCLLAQSTAKHQAFWSYLIIKHFPALK